MNKIKTFLAAVLLASFASASLAAATDYTALREDPTMHEALFGVSVAWLINENCPELTKRVIYGASQMLKLQRYGRGLGYSNRELTAYIEDKDEQARFRALVEPYLVAQGLDADDSDSWCWIGRAEMAAGTIAGSLLREK